MLATAEHEAGNDAAAIVALSSGARPAAGIRTPHAVGQAAGGRREQGARGRSAGLRELFRSAFRGRARQAGRPAVANGKGNEALREYQVLLALQPLDTATAKFGLARAYRQTGDAATRAAPCSNHSILPELPTCPETAAGNDWRPTTMTDTAPSTTLANSSRFGECFDSIRHEVRKVIVGQEEVIDQMLIALFVGGHCLITGLPGTGQDACWCARWRRRWA